MKDDRFIDMLTDSVLIVELIGEIGLVSNFVRNAEVLDESLEQFDLSELTELIQGYKSALALLPKLKTTSKSLAIAEDVLRKRKEEQSSLNISGKLRPKGASL